MTAGVGLFFNHCGQFILKCDGLHIKNNPTVVVVDFARLKESDTC